jgi:hypothetical protein
MLVSDAETDLRFLREKKHCDGGYIEHSEMWCINILAVRAAAALKRGVKFFRRALKNKIHSMQVFQFKRK